ncbi:hypothetical protein TBLA_0C01300 [Henningerozyma blattae CBS 6284]|uniref:Flavodoxin-like fold domain-containing protein n=1 Tax=Henningerozyma blattae (strain ATCC 34711 / CBS 6284 / DSM 70876 / NBRC 10599 / NRRL Y-10934 / UCD 77-7) TaxID=1071380 RepID=I2H0P3_HENB6|nr:hypothetical protein TBLA_0C01300 [Tetrapisispora blattae CBS 6284]CCH59945.1 hypothetical protein TBLA_0C01300 [Tetrapisispora blattae CBS 6284]
MKVLIVYAHPEKQSLTHSLKEVAVQKLKEDGHEVIVSDLYAMKWQASIEPTDFLNHDEDTRLNVMLDSGIAYEAGALTEDVLAEQEKLRWADTVIFQFPFWWFHMPAIMKGWIDRVFSFKFAYGVGEHTATHYGDQYGEGPFTNKRALIITTIGGHKSHYTERGIGGNIDYLLFPINHGILYYPGFQVLPSFCVYETIKMNNGTFNNWADKLRNYLDDLETKKRIPYRIQNGGDYNLLELTLKEGTESPGQTGLNIHLDLTK